MTVSELNTLHTVCELERTQLLTILAMSVKNTQLAGFLLTQNRSNFLYVEGSTAWLYECQHHISYLYIDEQCYDKTPIHYQDTSNLLIRLPVKLLTMPLLYPVKIILKSRLLLIPILMIITISLLDL